MPAVNGLQLYIFSFTLIYSWLLVGAAITSPFVNLYSEVSAKPRMPFRLVPQIDNKGTTASMRLLVKLSQTQAGLSGGYGVAIAPSYFASGQLLNISDIYGNVWGLREAYQSHGISISFAKTNASFEAALGDGSPANNVASVSESFGFGFNTTDDALCSKTDQYRCCYVPGLPWTQYMRYTMSSTEGVPNATCAPLYGQANNNTSIVNISGFGYDYAIKMTLFSSSALTLSGTVWHDLREGNDDSNTRLHVAALPQPEDPLGNASLAVAVIKSIMARSPLRLRSLQSAPTQPIQLCSRDNFTSEPFSIPQPIDVLGGVGLTLPTYLSKRPCTIAARAGYYTSPDANNEDSLGYYIAKSKTELFGNSSTGFGCKWGGLLSPPLLGKPMRASLQCDEQLAHAITMYLSLPPHLFQPLFPVISLVGKQGVLDLRLGILRASVNVLVIGDGPALVAAIIVNCTFYGQFSTNITTILASSPSNTTQNISGSTVERLHALAYGVGLSSSSPESTFLNQTIGYCILRLEPNGVKSPFMLYPTLKAINISIVVIRSVALAKTASHTFMQTDLQNNSRERRAAIFHAQHDFPQSVVGSGRKATRSVFLPSASLVEAPPRTMRNLASVYFPTTAVYVPKVTTPTASSPTNVSTQSPASIPAPVSPAPFMVNPANWPSLKMTTYAMNNTNSGSVVPAPCQGWAQVNTSDVDDIHCTYWVSGITFEPIDSHNEHPFIFDNGTWKIDVSDLPVVADSDATGLGFADLLDLFDDWQGGLTFGLFLLSAIFMVATMGVAKRRAGTWCALGLRLKQFFKSIDV